MEQEHQFIDYIEQSIIKNWDKDSLTDYKGITLQYKDVARKIAKFHIVLEFSMNLKRIISIILSTTPKPNCFLSATRHGKT